ncbi:MAG TPA: MqnA/MqnD/SBP family protein [Desulfosarcina sp.]|nr:MqnA/MqnD/SBP family protein [Desulfosarcina sp.]
MSVSVAMIPYTNMAPYRQLGPPEGCRFVPLVPRASVAALMAGEVAAAAVPVGGLHRLTGIVEPLGRFGIAAKGACMSVLLFSRCPATQLCARNTLRLTDESASSVRLLYLLLGNACGFDRLPRLAGEGQAPDAELLIGDRALVRGAAAGQNDDAAYVTDLSQMWYEHYGLPFVFARWVVRKDAPQQLKAGLRSWLQRFRAEEETLVAQAIPQAAKRLALAPELVQRYFKVIRRCLDDSDMAGQQQFLGQIERFGREPFFPAPAATPQTKAGDP